MDDPIGPIDLSDPVERHHPLNRGRLGWWLALPGLDGGRMLYDLMGKNHATLGGVSAWQRPGPPGAPGSILFDGGGAYADCGSPAEFVLTSQFTVAIWANANTWTSDYKDYLFAREGSSPPYWSYGIRTDSGGLISAKVGTTSEQTASAVQPATGAWFHAAATYDGANLKLYLNGVEAATSAVSGAINDSGSALYIGNCPGDVNRGFDGRLADASLWSRALSAAEVEADYDLSRAGYPGVLRRRPRPVAAFAPTGGAPTVVFPWATQDRPPIPRPFAVAY